MRPSNSIRVLPIVVAILFLFFSGHLIFRRFILDQIPTQVPGWVVWCTFSLNLFLFAALVNKSVSLESRDS